jgi:RNA 2',3'-cyclic 3'-phosphodiesterase
MPRLFTALSLPDDVRLRLSMLRSPIDGARWLPAEKLHVTLRFFGDVSGRVARDLMEEFDDVAAQPFQLSIKGTGAFGGRSPSVLYATVVPTPELVQLQKAHDRIARRLGLPAEVYPFHPHVTLARLRGASNLRVAEFLGAHGSFSLPPLTVSGFALMSSRPNIGGGPYVVEAQYPFRGVGYGDEDDDADIDEDRAAEAIQWDSRL